MGEGVHTGSGRQGRRHTHHELRVVNGHVRGDAPVNDGHFHVAGFIGDDAEARHFRSGTSGGIDSHIGGEAIAGFVYPFVILYFPAVSHEQAHALAAVVRATAPEGDEAVALFVVIHFGGVVDVGGGGVGHGTIEHFIRHFMIFKDIGNFLENTGFNDALVSDDKGIFAAELSQTIGNSLSGVHTNESGTRNKE